MGAIQFIRPLNVFVINRMQYSGSCKSFEGSRHLQSEMLGGPSTEVVV